MLMDIDRYSDILCTFVLEVKKIGERSNYPGVSLYQLCATIQCYLNEKGNPWKLVDGADFQDIRMHHKIIRLKNDASTLQKLSQ